MALKLISDSLSTCLVDPCMPGCLSAFHQRRIIPCTFTHFGSCALFFLRSKGKASLCGERNGRLSVNMIVCVFLAFAPLAEINISLYHHVLTQICLCSWIRYPAFETTVILCKLLYLPELCNCLFDVYHHTWWSTIMLLLVLSGCILGLSWVCSFHRKESILNCFVWTPASGLVQTTSKYKKNRANFHSSHSVTPVSCSSALSLYK